jgi:DNA (cytosine-5)-methyltransferase 1
MNKHKFKYKWTLKDTNFTKDKGKVFSCFACGGGSTMGYKLAGFDVLGCNEIDQKIADVYKTNHNPKYLFVEDIREFANRKEFPKDLYNLDILDGSPPCSSFSMAGNREKDWGKEKKFREGQTEQRLDDLFFDYIKLAKKLQPKVVIAENVKGLIQGNAKVYVRKIKTAFEDAGYKVQLFLLNAASMGVPQKRERVFFICQRNDLNFSKLELHFNEKPIKFKEFDLGNINRKKITSPYHLKLMRYVTHSGVLQTEKDSIGGKIGAVGFGYCVLENTTPNTITSGGVIFYKNKTHYATDKEIKMIGSFPLDYNFKNIEPKYLIGMSVPPVMTAQIATEIDKQWLNNNDA